MLHAAFLRSPYAHARIARIETDAARRRPASWRVRRRGRQSTSAGRPCASEMPDRRHPQHRVLADDRVYFVGHPVAVVVARIRYLARDAAMLIDVDYEPLPVVTDPEQALEPRSRRSPTRSRHQRRVHLVDVDRRRRPSSSGCSCGRSRDLASAWSISA